MSAGLKVRKQFILDPEKIKTVKEIVNAETDTEAINRAMDIVIANSKILTTLKYIKGKGNIQDIYGSKIS